MSKVSEYQSAEAGDISRTDLAYLIDGQTSKKVDLGTLFDNATVLATGTTTARTLAAWMSDVINVKAEGAAGDGSTDDRADIAAADTAAAAAGKPLYFPASAAGYLIASNLTIASPVIFAPGARLEVPTGVTVTLGSSVVAADDQQIFELAGTGAVAFTHPYVREVYPEWWGAAGDAATDDSAEFQAMITAAQGRLMKLGAASYLIGTALTSTMHVHIEGVGNGYGPGAAAQVNDSSVTRILLGSSTAILLTVTDFNQSSVRKLQINVPVANRPMTAGGGLLFNGDTGGVAPIIEEVAFLNLFRPVDIARPFTPEITRCYFDDWVSAAIRLRTSSGVEAAGGYIHRNRFNGEAGSTTQGAAIYSEVGYLHVINNTILGASYGVRVAVANNPAGNISVLDNMIENQGIQHIRVESADGSLASMVRISRNELSNVAFMDAQTGGIVIAENTTTPKWVQDIEILDNVIRSQASSASEPSYIWVQAGEHILVRGNQVQELGAESSRGIRIAGVTINTGYTAPIQVLDNQIVGVDIPYTFNATTLTQVRDMTGIAFASLPTNIANGSQVYVTDGTAGAPLTGSGTGSLAVRLNGAWKGL